VKRHANQQTNTGVGKMHFEAVHRYHRQSQEVSYVTTRVLSCHVLSREDALEPAF
jgi:hypothetical protein